MNRLNSKRTVFDVNDSFLVFISTQSSNNQFLYTYNIYSCNIDSFALPKQLFRFSNPLLDIKFKNRNSFLILTMSNLYEFTLNNSNENIVSLRKFENRTNFNTIHYNKIKDEVILSANFCITPQSKTKIKIENLKTGKIFTHDVKCDPFSIHPYYRLVSVNSKMQYVCLMDNFDNSFAVLDSSFNLVAVKKVLNYTIQDSQRDKICNLLNEYESSSNSSIYDLLRNELDQIPTLENISFINDTTLLMYGEDRIRDSIFPIISVVKIDDNWNITGKLSVNYLIERKYIEKKFEDFMMPFNPYSFNLKIRDGYIYLLSNNIDFKLIAKGKDYYAERNRSELFQNYCIYRFKLNYN